MAGSRFSGYVRCYAKLLLMRYVQRGSADDGGLQLMLVSMGGSPYLLLALVGWLMMCMRVAV